MSILLYVSIAWVTLCVVFVGLDLIFLLIVEHASDTSQAMAADESISDQAPQMAKLDLAMEHRRPGCGDPHIVLQLRHMLFRGGFLREGPRQHELGLEHRLGPLDHAVDGRRHPALDGMEHLPLHLGDDLAGMDRVTPKRAL